MILTLGVAAAMYGLAHQTATATACQTRRTVWDFEHVAAYVLTQPRPLNDPRLTAQQRALRATNNAATAQTRKTLLESLGRRPSC